jgi:hypothetical protein
MRCPADYALALNSDFGRVGLGAEPPVPTIALKQPEFMHTRLCVNTVCWAAGSMVGGVVLDLGFCWRSPAEPAGVVPADPG